MRPLALLNDSKQVAPEDRERLFHAVAACATKVVVRVIPSERIDSDGLHRSNLRALREALAELTPPAEVCLVDGFRLGSLAPEHRAVVDGDTKSAAIAAASIVAKVTRDRAMRRLDALFPHYGFASHVGYITPRHSAVVRERGPCGQHRRSFQALCYAGELEVARAYAERRVRRHFRLRGYRILAANAWAGGNELDLVVRRGNRIVVCEVKAKSGDGFGDPSEMVTEEKARRVCRAAESVARDASRTARLRCGARGGRGAGRKIERVPF